MPPKSIYSSIDEWIKELNNRRHLKAVKYIEENVDLIDTDLQKFLDDCPIDCQLEVYEMFLKAGIDMKDYVMNGTLKKWDRYIHDANPQYHQYYTVDYEKEIDSLTWKMDWRHDAIVLDTISVVNEG